MQTTVQLHEPFKPKLGLPSESGLPFIQSNRNPVGFCKPLKTGLRFSIGIAVFAAISGSAQHHVEYGVNTSLGLNYYEHYEQGQEPVGPVSHDDGIEGYGAISGIANVGFGVNKARISMSATNANNPIEYDYGFASSRYWDSFQFSDPRLDGTHGFFDATLYIAGSGATTLTGQYLTSPDTEFDAFWHGVINVTVDGVTAADGGPIQSVYYAGEWYKGFDESTLGYFGDPLNTYQQTMTFEFIYGQPILMDAFLQVDVQFDNQTSLVPGTLNTVIDLGNSSYWGGIRRLRDSGGNPVADASYSSSSGVDYRLSSLPRPTLNIAKIGGQVQLSWPGAFQLQGASSPNGPYTTIAGAKSPYQLAPVGAQKFFRLAGP
jgi:hypothetical protein